MRIPKFSCHGCQTSLSTYLLISGLCNLFFFLKYRILRTLTNVMSSCLAAWVNYSGLRRCPIHEYASPRWSEDFCCVYYIFHCLLYSICFTVFQQFTEKGTYWRQMTAISSWNPFFIFFILKWDKIYAWLTFFRASLFWGKY